MAQLNKDLVNWLPSLHQRLRVEEARKPDESLIYAQRAAFNMWINVGCYLLNVAEPRLEPHDIEPWTGTPGEPIWWRRDADGVARPTFGDAPVVVGGELKPRKGRR